MGYETKRFLFGYFFFARQRKSTWCNGIAPNHKYKRRYLWKIKCSVFNVRKRPDAAAVLVSVSAANLLLLPFYRIY